MAEENPWGYKRIAGERKKLSYQVSPGMVKNILRKNGLFPSPERKGMDSHLGGLLNHYYKKAA